MTGRKAPAFIGQARLRFWAIATMAAKPPQIQMWMPAGFNVLAYESGLQIGRFYFDGKDGGLGKIQLYGRKTKGCSTSSKAVHSKRTDRQQVQCYENAGMPWDSPIYRVSASGEAQGCRNH